MTLTREQRLDRRMAGFALLLWLCFPAGIVAWIATADWRWVAAGTVALLTGFAVGGILVAGHKGRRPQ